MWRNKSDRQSGGKRGVGAKEREGGSDCGDRKWSGTYLY
jgi:hypothetical protein